MHVHQGSIIGPQLQREDQVVVCQRLMALGYVIASLHQRTPLALGRVEQANTHIVQDWPLQAQVPAVGVGCPAVKVEAHPNAFRLFLEVGLGQRLPLPGGRLSRREAGVRMPGYPLQPAHLECCTAFTDDARNHSSGYLARHEAGKGC